MHGVSTLEIAHNNQIKVENMKKIMSLLALSFLLVSCYEKARVRILETNAIVITDAMDYDDFKVGDTVQLEKTGLSWEISRNAIDLVNKSEIIEYQTSNGDTSAFLYSRAVGVIESIR